MEVEASEEQHENEELEEMFFSEGAIEGNSNEADVKEIEEKHHSRKSR